MSKGAIGQPLSRVEGPLKVSGRARYSAEIPLSKVAYAVLVGSNIARGKISAIEITAAQKADGVIKILTHNDLDVIKSMTASLPRQAGQQLPIVLTTDVITYPGQYVAVVVADTLEAAQHASALVKISYSQDAPVISTEDKRAQRYSPQGHLGRPINKSRGDADNAFANAPVKVDNFYSTPIENHNPMEPHATTAYWEGDRLVVYDASQYPAGIRTQLAKIFAVPDTNVRVVSTFVGGAFGSKGTMWPHVPLAVLAARVTGRPVKLVLARKQMFTNVGHRPETHQRVALGANKDGTLTAIIHEGTSDTSIEGEFVEQFTIQTPVLYQCQNVRVAQELVRVNRVMPTFMRAPGEATGTYGLECAMDELAHALQMDPIELRMKNYAQTDQEANQPFSSKSLDKCYQLGAEKMGWSRRRMQPGTHFENGLLVGIGMASSIRGAKHFNGAIGIELETDGKFVLRCSTVEQGCGTITVLAQIAADVLAVAPDLVRCEIGDTDFPIAPIAAGSGTVMTMGNAAYCVAGKLQEALIGKLIAANDSPFHGANPAEIAFDGGTVGRKSGAGPRLTYQQALQCLAVDHLKVDYKTDFDDASVPYGKQGFGAQFAEVTVDPDLGEVRLSRFVSVVACGRVMNMKTCLSQVRSGAIWGIGMALLEETVTDARSGRILNANLAEYRVPVNADAVNIEGYVVDEDDQHLGPIGAKGVGELGMAGTAAAVANAVFNATGKRIRNLPITVDKLIS